MKTGICELITSLFISKSRKETDFLQPMPFEISLFYNWLETDPRSSIACMISDPTHNSSHYSPSSQLVLSNLYYYVKFQQLCQLYGASPSEGAQLNPLLSIKGLKKQPNRSPHVWLSLSPNQTIDINIPDAFFLQCCKSKWYSCLEKRHLPGSYHTAAECNRC